MMTYIAINEPGMMDRIAEMLTNPIFWVGFGIALIIKILFHLLLKK